MKKEKKIFFFFLAKVCFLKRSKLCYCFWFNTEMFYERKVWSLNGSKVNYASFNQQTCGKYFTLFFTKFIDENVPRIWEEQQTET